MNEQGRKHFWMGLAVLHLALVALFGFLLRTKILFSIAFLDYRNLLQAHSHFAFTGWLGLGLVTLLVYSLLPPEVADSRKYQRLLMAITLAAWGIAFLFPLFGFKSFAVIFPLLYMVLSYVFAFLFGRDVQRHVQNPTVRWLAYGSVGTLALSSIGMILLAYIFLAGSTNSVLYRAANYIFLHFQYNGFFTLAVFTIYAKQTMQSEALKPSFQKFALFQILAAVPATYLSLLWIERTSYYIIGGIGALLMVISLYHFLRYLTQSRPEQVFRQKLAVHLWKVAGLSFVLKTMMQIGTLVPSLGHAVFSDRPVIIGFMHLVFLAFVSFYVLAVLVKEGFFTDAKGKPHYVPIVVFAAGVISNEIFLGVQGLEILFQTNSYIYNWLLWGSTILLFAGAALMCAVRWEIARKITGRSKQN
jgi:hypothetical protein